VQLISDLFSRLMTWVEDQKEEGQTLVEYALIIVLVSVVVVGTLGLLGDEINNVFTTITGELGGASGGT
jgi:pilus assembly protein Flp/PilA